MCRTQDFELLGIFLFLVILKQALGSKLTMDSIHLEDIPDMKIQTDDRCLEMDQLLPMLLTLPDKMSLFQNLASCLQQPS